ncbi:hypothetical protein N0V94_007687 [Neodidymelliopsis sp. IMI 364377]|nr:hypothetical protein N0V94_007687 [Neodidymelliopsis sp. IMI 364377]
MAEALLCVSVLQNTTSLFEQAFRILRRLRTAYERQKNLVDVLNQHEAELKSIKTIIGIIEDEKELQTDAVGMELARIKDVQTKLKDLLVFLDPNTKGRMNQIARQFVHGSADEKKLTVIMNELGTAKQTLLLRIQVAQVGVMRNMQKELVANAEVIQRIDESLREQVLNCEGLRIARLLKDRSPADDGTVSISAEELAAVTRVESDASSDDGTLVDESDAPPHDLPIKNGRDVHHNKAKDESVQINAAIEKDIWKDFDRISIRHNQSEGRAVQVNHANPLEVMAFFRSWQRENNAKSRQKPYESVV